MELEEVKNILENAWCKETAHSSAWESYEQKPKSTGQCAVTTLVVNDYFGGEIIRGYATVYKISHYWNRINGVDVDFTRDQFDPNVQFDDVQTRTREYLESNADTMNRYHLLKERVEAQKQKALTKKS
jgi:hypothetical protein